MTDIEASTRLFHELGESYAVLLREHEDVLRAAFSAYRGVVVETEGDALFLAFPDAADAVIACVTAQRSLAARGWPGGADIHVRMGVHTGRAKPAGERYVALAVHQAARICAAAHGDQVLLSEATTAAARDRLPADVTVAALGSFQLRGFPAPERLFQVRHPDLRETFPPLRALGVVPHNLPFVRSSFVGRAEERAAVAGHLLAGGLVTIVGPGGVGKTRLAVQVAFDVMEEFADGAWFVELAPVPTHTSASAAVAAAVGIAEEPGRPIGDTLVDALASKAALVLVDNCEHVLDTIAALAERLSQHCPQLAFLATSREPLDIDGELVWNLDPLPVADPGDVRGQADAAQLDAVRLFVERASLVRPAFHLDDDNAVTVSRIVAQVDGMPLAIELAAAALADRPLDALARGLVERFSLLTGGRRTAPERHRTLRAALEWSLDLLASDERRLFTRLATFAGGGTVAAATEVGGAPPVAERDVPAIIRRLKRASLLAMDLDTAERWSMLASVHALAELELAASDDADEVTARHRAWYARWAEDAEHDVGRSGRAEVMRDLVAEHDNIRRAIESAITAQDATVALRLCIAMVPFWTSRGDWTEGVYRLRAALALTGGGARLRTRAMIATGDLLLLRGDLADAEDCFAEAGARAMAAGDDATTARALAGAGYVTFRNSRLADAREMWERALAAAERADDERIATSVVRSLAVASASSGDQIRAGELLDRAIGSAQRMEDDQLLRQLLGSSAERHLWLGRYDVAARQYGEALELATAIGDLSARPLLLTELGWVALLRGDVATAERLSVEAVELAEDLGNRRVLAQALRLRGEALMRCGAATEAASSLEHAQTVAEAFGAPAEIAGVRSSQACLALEELHVDDARRLAEEAIGARAMLHPMRRTSPRWVLGVAALTDDDLHAAERYFRDDIAASTRPRGPVPRHEANGIHGLAVVNAAAGRVTQAVELHLRALELRRQIGDRLGVADSLVGLGAIALGIDPDDAGRLIGAATALRTRAGAAPTKRERAELSAMTTTMERAQEPASSSTARDRRGPTDEDAAIAIALRLGARV